MGRRLQGKVAVVTGSGQGIGRGIALYLAGQGAKVITNNRKPLDRNIGRDTGDLTLEQREKLDSMRGDAVTVAEEIAAMGGEATPFFGDVSDYKTAGELVRAAVEIYGRIDILINNAAGLGQGTIIDTTEEQWDYMTLAKMKGAYNTMHHAVPHMIKQGSGCILNCASNAWTGISNLCAYSAGNAGVVGLSKAAAKELRQYGITVNVYCPQAESPGHLVEFNKTVKALREKVPEGALDEEKLRRVEADHGDPIRLAPFLAYLCTEEASEITGTVFGVTASGRVELYSEPEIISSIENQTSWTIDELEKEVPEKLLKPHVAVEKRDDWTCTKPDKEEVPITLFPAGEKREGFHGETYINMFTGFDHPSGCPIGNVVFSPGARNDWHVHDTYQVLLVTDGEGYYQEWGREKHCLQAGDVVVVEPGVKHWHGATETTWFAHVGIITGKNC